MLGTAVVLLLLASGFFVWGRGGSPTPEDPLAYAASLHDRVFPSGAPPRYGLLKEDEALRAEYLRALDNPSSLVRRTAVDVLMRSGVPLPTSRLEDLLSNWNETLDYDLEIAATGGGRRHLADALDRGRSATLASLLLGIPIQNANAGETVRGEVILPFVQHGDPSVRSAAAYALTSTVGFKPGEEIEGLMRTDEDPHVRTNAARCLLDRGGGPGARTVIEFLLSHEDWALERSLTPRLQKHPDGIAFSRGRVASDETDIHTGMVHLNGLSVGGLIDAPPERLIERALANGHGSSLTILAQVAAREGWDHLRSALQDAWRTQPDGARRDRFGHRLTIWHTSSPEERDQQMALEILGTGYVKGARGFLDRLGESEHATVRAEVAKLLAHLTDR